MLDGVHVEQNDIDPYTEGFNELTRLPRVLPDLELETMAAYLVQVFLSVESELLLPIISAVIVVEQ